MSRLDKFFNNHEEDDDNDFQGDFEGFQWDIELKPGEAMFMLEIEFPNDNEILMVRDREMAIITKILNYNRFPYVVTPVA